MIIIAAEDAALLSLAERILRSLDDQIPLDPEPALGGKINFKRNLPKLNNRAKAGRFCIALCDSDQDTFCPAQQIRNWIGVSQHHNLVVRLAVQEAEAWILADSDGFSDYFLVDRKRIYSMAGTPESLRDPKKCLLQLVKSGRFPSSRKRDMLPDASAVSSKGGMLYNAEIKKFIASHWCPARAAVNAPSLQRAIAAFRNLVERYHADKTVVSFD
jgi:hypothetical protein